MNSSERLQAIVDESHESIANKTKNKVIERLESITSIKEQDDLFHGIMHNDDDAIFVNDVLTIIKTGSYAIGPYAGLPILSVIEHVVFWLSSYKYLKHDSALDFVNSMTQNEVYVRYQDATEKKEDDRVLN